MGCFLSCISTPERGCVEERKNEDIDSLNKCNLENTPSFSFEDKEFDA